MSLRALRNKVDQLETALHALRHLGPVSLARFLLTMHRPSPARTLHIAWDGEPLYYRPGTSDIWVLTEVLFRVEGRCDYTLDYKGAQPSVIFDIGGNIGVSAVYFAGKFPQSKIYVFEPEPSNFTLLRKNTAPYKTVTAYPFALGARTEKMPLYRNADRANVGGFSLVKDGIEGADICSEVEVRGVAEVIDEIGVSKIDLIKIDTEGAEYDILTALPKSILGTVQWITGELHSNRDWDLLQYLSPWFDIGVTHRQGTSLSTFSAYRRR